jgi:two-component system cell cycle response regulator DivK
MISLDIKDWTVLIVDDESDNLGVAQKVLSYGGAKVHIARNGIEGLDVLETVIPTFILLDLSMPEMDGWEMCRTARSNQEMNNVPIIALTAHAMAGDKERALQAGFDGYIAKPFRINSFMEDILVCLRQFGTKA